MKLLRGMMVALLATGMLVWGSAMAASTTNYSDQWWVPAEDGWGASVLQQHDVLFVDLFVYGADSRATWFTAAVFLQAGSPVGHTVFTGDLYRTTGPYFGAPFNPAAVVRARVGTLTFDADSATTAVMTYTVEGTTVVKSVERISWRNENIGGIYVGGLTHDEVCGNANSERVSEHVHMDITHRPDNTVSIALRVTSDDEEDIACTITGNYGQSGHIGRILGAAAQCMGGTVTGTFNLFEIERSVSGLLARFDATIRTPEGSCTFSNGSIGGVRKF
jgi:hypothetical protein